LNAISELIGTLGVVLPLYVFALLIFRLGAVLFRRGRIEERSDSRKG
jgi:F0F1-type ATP synthase assembly protein I